MTRKRGGKNLGTQHQLQSDLPEALQTLQSHPLASALPSLAMSLMALPLPLPSLQLPALPPALMEPPNLDLGDNPSPADCACEEVCQTAYKLICAIENVEKAVQIANVATNEARKAVMVMAAMQKLGHHHSDEDEDEDGEEDDYYEDDGEQDGDQTSGMEDEQDSHSEEGEGEGEDGEGEGDGNEEDGGEEKMQS